jgi:hypothetical protein
VTSAGAAAGAPPGEVGAVKFAQGRGGAGRPRGLAARRGRERGGVPGELGSPRSPGQGPKENDLLLSSCGGGRGRGPLPTLLSQKSQRS